MTDFEVIDGGDRVLAFRSLYGEGCKITADVGYEITPDQALLIHIDKNISRRERDVLERGELMLLRRQILARTNQLAQAGNNRFTMQQAGDTVKTRAMLAKEANLSPRSTQLYERIAAKLTPETKQAVRDAGWENNTRMLTRIAGIEPEIEGSEDDNPIENSERVLKEVSKAQIAEIRRIKAEDEDKAVQKADEQAQRTARQEARQASKPSPIQGSRRNLVAVPSIVEIKQGDVWRLDHHTVFCGPTSGGGKFQEMAPDAKLAIVPILKLDQDRPAWDHDWLVNSAEIVAVIASAEMTIPFAMSQRMPYRGVIEIWLLQGNRPVQALNAFLFSHSMVETPTLRIRSQSIEEAVRDLVGPLTGNGDTVISSAAIPGLLPMATQRGFYCYMGSEAPDECASIIRDWKTATGKVARKADMELVAAAG